MSSELSLKQISLNKGLSEPDELGIINCQLEVSLKGVKSKSIKDMTPTDEELALIAEYSMVEPDKANFLMLRNVDPIGDPKAVDSHLDKFSRQAEKDLVEGAPGTPLLKNHDHDLGNSGPVGYVIASKLTNKGPRETIAIPLDNGNDAIVKGLLNGSINKLSVGIQVYHADTLCNSCEKATSIYASACPHMPGQKDEKGNVTTKTINKVARYLERSLVNIPARLGTSVKSLEIIEEIASLGICTTEELAEATGIGMSKALESAFGDTTEASTDSQNSTSDTITPVNKTTEECTVADDQKEVKAEEVVVETAKKAETEVKAEATVEETVETAKAEEAKVEAAEAVTETKELKVSLSEESSEIIKSLTAASTDTSAKVEKLLETVTTQAGLIAKQSEQLEASAKQIEALTELQKALVETVDKAVGVTTEDVLKKFMEVVKAASVAKEAKSTPVDNSDLLSQFGV